MQIYSIRKLQINFLNNEIKYFPVLTQNIFNSLLFIHQFLFSKRHSVNLGGVLELHKYSSYLI